MLSFDAVTGLRDCWSLRRETDRVGGQTAPSSPPRGRLYVAPGDREGTAMGGWRGDHGPARPGAGRGRGGVRSARRSVPARAPGALLPVARLGGRCRGCAAGDLAIGLAGAGRV